MSEKIIDRVRKLLNQAEGTNNEHEAAAFMAKAHSLMLKHAIDQSALGSLSEERESIISQFYEVPSRQTGVKARRALLSTVVGIAKCKLVKYGPQSSTRYEITGFEGDVAYAKALYESLLTQMRNALRIDGGSSTTAKNNFMWGWVERVSARLVEATVQEERTAISMSSSTAIVLRDRFAEVEERFAQKYPKLRKASFGKPGSYDMSARERGRAAGNQADLGVGTSVGRGVKGAISR